MFVFLTVMGISSRVPFDHVMLFRSVVLFVLLVCEVRLVTCFGCETQTTFRVLFHGFVTCSNPRIVD